MFRVKSLGLKQQPCWGSCADCDLSRLTTSHSQVQNPVTGGCWDAESCELLSQLAQVVDIKSKAKVHEEHPGIHSRCCRV